MEVLLTELAKAIKAVYKDPEPQNGILTEKFFKMKAEIMILKYPEKVIPTLMAYDKLVKDVNSL